MPGVLFALALIDASIIGAAAVSLATAYAVSDVLSIKHSLHRKPSDAKLFYAIYVGLVAVAAGLVLTPGVPLGLLTNAVQTLAGVLLPSATVFLLLLCNDKAVLGPWANSTRLNIFTGAVIAVLVMLSVILTASVLFPGMTSGQTMGVLAGGVRDLSGERRRPVIHRLRSQHEAGLREVSGAMAKIGACRPCGRCRRK